ncbi:MAG TPA: DUF3592 domain-containing protein [Ktedonobacteraceae bacterium]
MAGAPPAFSAVRVLLARVPAFSFSSSVSWQAINLRRTGMTVEGHIAAKRSREGGGGSRSGGRASTTYLVAYSYDSQGKTHSHEQDVGKEYFDAFQPGESVSVRYHARHPKVALLEGTVSEREPSLLRVCCSLFQHHAPGV